MAAARVIALFTCHLLISVANGALTFDNAVYNASDFARLHHAIRTYNELQAFTLIEYDFHRNVDVQNSSGWAPLHVAAQTGSEAFAAFLIDNHADLRLKTIDGLEPIHIAVINNRLSFAQLLLQADARLADEVCCGEAKKSLSHLAAEYGVTEFLYLMARYFDPDALDGIGQRPICWAARNGSEEFARKLIEDRKFGPKPNVDASQCFYGEGDELAPLLHVAAYYHKLPFVAMLKLKHANMSSVDSDAGNALHALAKNNQGDYTEASTIAVELVESGTNLEGRDKHGRTPYLQAILSNSIDLARVFALQFRVNTEAADGEEMTAFHLATSVEAIEFLANRSVSFFNEINRLSGGLSPLHNSVRQNRSIEYIAQLISKGADVLSKTSEEKTILHLAIEYNNRRMLIYFLQPRFSPNVLQSHKDIFGKTPMFTAIERNKTDMAVILIDALEQGDQVLNLQAPQFKNFTPLHQAVRNHNVALIEKLIESGANVTLMGANGRAALHEAVVANDLKSLRKIIEMTTPELLSMPDRLGRSCLHLAVTNEPQASEITRFILRKCDKVINNVDMFGDTPLQRAIFHESISVVQVLLQHNASCGVLDAQDRTPIMLARQINNDELLRLVLSYCNTSKKTEKIKVEPIALSTVAKLTKGCSTTPAVVNGNVEHGPAYIGALRKLTCNRGYVTEGNGTVSCSESEEKWVVDGFCRKACSGSFKIQNGEIDVTDGSNFGLTGVIRCSAGNRLNGINFAYCKGDGEWEVSGRCQSSIPVYYTPRYFSSWTKEGETLLQTGADIQAIVTLQDRNQPYESPTVLVITHQGHVTALSRHDWTIVEWRARLSLEDIYILHAVYDSVEDELYLSNYGNKVGQQIYRVRRWDLMSAGGKFGTHVPLRVLVSKEQSQGRKYRGLTIDSDSRILFACDYDGDVKDVSIWRLEPRNPMEPNNVHTKLVGTLKMAFPPMFSAFHAVPRLETPLLLGGRSENGYGHRESESEGDDVFLLAVSDHNGNKIQVHAASLKLFLQTVRNQVNSSNDAAEDSYSIPRGGSPIPPKKPSPNPAMSSLFRHVTVVAQQDKLAPANVGSVYCPNELEFDPLGNLFVADNCNYRVQAFELSNNEDIWAPMRVIWALNSTTSHQHNIFRFKVTKNPKTREPALLANVAGNQLVMFN